MNRRAQSPWTNLPVPSLNEQLSPQKSAVRSHPRNSPDRYLNPMKGRIWTVPNQITFFVRSAAFLILIAYDITVGASGFVTPPFRWDGWFARAQFESAICPGAYLDPIADKTSALFFLRHPAFRATRLVLTILSQPRCADPHCRRGDFAVPGTAVLASIYASSPRPRSILVFLVV